MGLRASFNIALEVNFEVLLTVFSYFQISPIIVSLNISKNNYNNVCNLLNINYLL